MSICIDKLPHECGTRHGLQVFADEETKKVDGFCFSCCTYVRHPYGDEKSADEVELPPQPSEEEIAERLEEIDSYPTVHVKERKLSATDLGKMGVKVSLSEYDGVTPTALYFPMTKDGENKGYYVKTLGDRSITFAVGDVKGADPFNWTNAVGSGAHTLIITEGLADAVAMEAIHRKHQVNKQFMPAIISLPNGVKSVKSLIPLVNDLSRFKKVVFAFDMDGPGRDAVTEAMKIYPKGVSCTLPAKDANDCIIKGKMKEAYDAIWAAAPPKNSRVVGLSSLIEEARTPPEWGDVRWPFPSLDEKMRGIRKGETIYIGAGVKMGKSELLNHMLVDFVKQGHKVFAAKPEEALVKTTKMVLGKVAGGVFHDPRVEFDLELYDAAAEEMIDENGEDKLYLLDLYQHLGWETLKQDITYAASKGCRIVFIDPITNLTNGVAASDANTALSGIAEDAAVMAKDLGLTIFFFCHLKAPDGFVGEKQREKKYEEGTYVGLGSCPHEMGGTIHSNQFAGSRAMMRSCNLMLGLEGNKDPNLPDEIRNTRWLNILEDREFGNTGRTQIYWNPNTQLFKEC